ncbi:MAG: recombination regulator RecX [Treponema sp.]|nr:recombination regulator RecX [Treponema sp.]
MSGTGPFFIRTEYLSFLSPDSLKCLINYSLNNIIEPKEFLQEEEDDILNAKEALLAEKAALKSLARSEQCRFMLAQKLYEKNFSKAAVNKALDFLESKDFLNDMRFASSWIRTRAIAKAEGRKKLELELAARGIKRTCIKDVLDKYFSETSEIELCNKALSKLLRLKTPSDKLFNKLIQKGFSVKIVNTVISQSNL